MVERADKLGFNDPNHYLWFKCQWQRNDPTEPMRKWDSAWRALRAKAGLPALRFYDLRHTFITEMAETLVSDAVLQSITGQLSQRMLRHYTHIGMLAKRRAFDELDAQREKQRPEADSSSEETVQ
jgi:integrase